LEHISILSNANFFRPGANSKGTHPIPPRPLSAETGKKQLGSRFSLAHVDFSVDSPREAQADIRLKKRENRGDQDPKSPLPASEMSDASSLQARNVFPVVIIVTKKPARPFFSKKILFGSSRIA
jgi:hypothetical protein